MKSFIINEINELNDVAKYILSEYHDKKIFAFYGQLGAGKTTLIQKICELLGAACNVTSPTFAIVNEYSLKSKKYFPNNFIYHLDFYRINKLEEVFDIGYEEYLYSGNYCFIEWADKIGSLLPSDTIHVKIKVNKGVRKITIVK